MCVFIALMHGFHCVPSQIWISGETLLHSVMYILRGASSLLVLDYRVMRRPQSVERVTGILSTHFLYVGTLLFMVLSKAEGERPSIRML